jgi:hypothetical protein
MKNCLKNPQNPQRQVHALLGAEGTEDALRETRRHCQTDKIITADLHFAY